MTVVILDIDRIGVSGPERLPGTLTIEPISRHVTDSGVTLPVSVSIELPADDVWLTPTNNAWCYRVMEPGAQSARYVAVPDTESSVPYSQLIEIDLANFGPASKPVASWWAELDTQIVSGNVQNGTLILRRRNGDNVITGYVKGAKGERGSPGADGVDGADGADGADGEKGERGEKGDRGHLGTQGTRGLKGDKGEPGVDAVSDIVIDSSVGDRVFANGVRVYGDTGWCVIYTPTSMPIWGTVSSGNDIAIRRIGDIVQMSVRGFRRGDDVIDGDRTLFILPYGFRPDRAQISVEIINRDRGGYMELDIITTPSSEGKVTSFRYPDAGRHYGQLSFTTSDPWPTSLPVA